MKNCPSIKNKITNIERLTHANWLYSIKPILFNFKKTQYIDKPEAKRIYGIIAEEAENINKNICNFENPILKKGLIGINYENLIIPLICEIKILRNKIMTLEVNVARIKSRMVI